MTTTNSHPDSVTAEGEQTPAPRPRLSGLHPTTCLLAARGLRDFGDGFVAVLLPAYLLALGMTPLEVGVIVTVSLLGSAFLTIGAGPAGLTALTLLIAGSAPSSKDLMIRLIVNLLR